MNVLKLSLWLYWYLKSNLTLFYYVMRFWCGNSLMRGTSPTDLVHAPRSAKEISCLHTTEIKKKYVKTSIFLTLLKRSAKKLPKEERSAKMKNVYIIGISATRSNQIWHFTAPHHVTCVTLIWNYSHVICVTLVDERTLIIYIFIYNLWKSQLQMKFYM